MRNLKKILALVLALVMSLSLMATAGAESFQDVKDDNPYKTAIDVLTELKVVKGYGDGNFQPDGQLNRAEAAVLVYRIATGDVEDKYLDNYTFMQQSKFTDLDGYNWAKGYINYCQNAGIVVGTDATHFNPGGKVTGYQLLVMLLRTLGYGKAGEFADPKGWELQTAAIAEREGITANVTTGDFGAPAPRAMVAELLFRGLLTETVTYSALTSGGYTKGETLGMREFKLEEIEGVVTANEFADLYSDQVLPEGRTNLEVAEDDIRSLAISTEITDIGESRYAYITGSKVLAMGDTGNNKVTEFGSACDISTNAKFNAVAEMTKASDIEFYENFERSGYWTSDFRIEYEMYVGSVTEAFRTEYVEFNGGRFVENENGTGADTWTYHKLIPATDEITNADYDNIRSIFYRSNGRDWDDDKGTGYVYSGKVFVATQTTKDISDEISFNQFVDTYLKDKLYNDNWGVSFNGQWVKFVDNDGDGQAEYAFKTNSWLDEALEVYTNKDGATVTVFYDFDDDNDPRAVNGDYQVRYMNGETPAVGDKVIAAWIDNQILVEPAKNETATVSTYSWRDDVITTDKGDFGQSGIGNATDMLQYIATMSDKTEYIMYLDHFGYVRAYEWPGASNYALVTEIYARNNANGNIVRDWPMTVELSIPNEEKTDVDTKEYGLNGGSGNLFVTSSHNDQQAWTLINNYSAIGNYYNWLQPATAHMGVGASDFDPEYGVGKLTEESYRYWPKVSRQEVRQIEELTENDTFNYGARTYKNVNDLDVANAGTVSFTNVALADIDGENATLQGAARLKLDKNGSVMWYDVNKNGKWDAGERARYSVDYVQLSTTLPVAEDAVRYPIDSYTYDEDGNIIQDTAYIAANNNYVNAVHDTQYYIVYDGGVYYFKDFVNMPALTEKNVGEIHAAYAVAKDVSSDNADAPYWVADVIVYEVQKWNNDKAGSISLAYYTPSRATGDVQNLSTINAKNGLTQLVPGGRAWSADRWQWGNPWEGYGFYKLTNETAPEEGVMKASDITRIPSTAAGDYGANNIHAGIVTREAYIANGGWYIDVNMGWNAIYPWMGARVDMPETATSIASIEITDKIYSVTTGRDHPGDWDYNEATLLRYKNKNDSQVKAGDLVIWVGDAKATAVSASGVLSTTNFVVDLGNEKNNADLFNRTAAFLFNKNDEFFANGEWLAIMVEQVRKATGLSGVDADVAAAESAIANNDLEAMQAALKALTDNYPADKTNATDYKKASNEIAKLNLAIANQPIEAAIRDAINAMKAYREKIAKDYSTNPNLAAALKEIDNAIKAAQTSLAANKITDLSIYANDAALKAAVDAAVLKIGKATTNADTGVVTYTGDLKTIMDTLEPKVDTALQTAPTPDKAVRLGEGAPVGVTVTENVTDPEVDAWDVNIPKTVGEKIPAGEGTKIPLIFKSNVTPSVDEDTVPTGFTADLQKDAAAQTQSAAEVKDVAYTLTITKDYPSATWPADATTAITIILTSNETEEPEEPVGDYKVSVTVQGEAIEGLTISPKTTTNGIVPNKLTITAPEGQPLPANNTSGAEIAVTLNGEGYAYTNYNYAPSADKKNVATITFNNANMKATDNITVNILKALPAAQTATVPTVTVTGGPENMADGTVKLSPAKLYQGNKLDTLTLTGVPAGWLVNVTAIKNGTDSTATPLTEGSSNDYTFNAATNTITFKNQTVAAYVNVAVTLYQNATVTVNGDHITYNGSALKLGIDSTNTLTVKVDDGYALTAATVTVNGVEKTVSSVTNTTITLSASATIDGPVVINATVKKVAKVTINGTGLVASTTTPAKPCVGDRITSVTIALAPTHPSANWELPDTVSVTMNNVEVPESAYTYSAGTITFADVSSGVKPEITGDIVITASAVAKPVEAAIALAGTGASTLDATATGNKNVGGAMPTKIVLSQKDGQTAQYPAAKDNITIKMVDGTQLVFPEFAYDAATHTITFTDATQKVTGDITITLS